MCLRKLFLDGEKEYKMSNKEKVALILNRKCYNLIFLELESAFISLNNITSIINKIYIVRMCLKRDNILFWYIIINYLCLKII